MAAETAPTSTSFTVAPATRPTSLISTSGRGCDQTARLARPGGALNGDSGLWPSSSLSATWPACHAVVSASTA